MGRSPCCDKASVKRGPWSQEEDAVLRSFIQRFGNAGNWIALPQKAGLRRCGKSCRLRWLNYLRPALRHGGFTDEEDNLILSLFGEIGSKWSVIASRLPGRTDNDVKNYWNTKLKKRFFATTREETPTTPPAGGDTIAGAADRASETDDQTPAGAAVDSASESDQTTPFTLPALANLDTAIGTVDDDDDLLYKSEQLYAELMGLIEKQSMTAASSPALEATTSSITTSPSAPLLQLDHIIDHPSSPSPLGTSPTASSAGSSMWPLDMYDNTVMLSESSSSSSSLFEFDDPYDAHTPFGMVQLHDSFKDSLASSYDEVLVTQAGLLYY